MLIKSTQGQSLIELALVLPLFLGFWASFMFFAQILVIKIELLKTARHGIFWLAYNTGDGMPAQEESARALAECRSFLKRQHPSIDARRLAIRIEPGDRWKPIGPQGLQDLVEIFTLLEKFGRLMKDAAGLTPIRPAAVKLEYLLPSPGLLRAIPGFPASIPIRGSSVCYR